MIVEHKGIKFYIDNKLARDIMIYIDDMINDEEDLLILLVGKEGAGKSKFSRQLAWFVHYYLETKYNIIVPPNYNDIHFNLKEYMNTSLKGKKYQVNIMDESRRVLNRKRSTSRDAVDFTDYLSETRDAQQIHIILLPAYHDIEKYILMWRAKMVIKLEKYRHKETGKLIKGEGKVLPLDSRLIYTWEENRYRYPEFNPKKYGGYPFRFNNIECFEDIELYKEKKAKFRLEKYGDAQAEAKPLSLDEDFKKRVIEIVGVNTAAQIYDVHPRTITRHRSKIREKEKELAET